MPIQVLHVYNSDYTGKYGRRIFHILKQQKTKKRKSWSSGKRKHL